LPFAKLGSGGKLTCASAAAKIPANANARDGSRNMQFVKALTCLESTVDRIPTWGCKRLSGGSRLKGPAAAGHGAFYGDGDEGRGVFLQGIAAEDDEIG
jgi:hypothetical protein